MHTTVAIHVFTGVDAASTVKGAVPLLRATAVEPRPLLVPSSGETADALLSLLVTELRAGDVAPIVCVPAHGPRALMGSTWAPVEIETPDLPRHRVRIARALAGTEPWIVCDVDAVARTGPFILDVVSRYLHPLDRVRLLADRQRGRRAADLNLAIRPVWSVIGAHAGSGYLLAACHDPVAAELFALALSEQILGPEHAFTGPWEDPVVQRATELELGVVIPQQIEFVVHGNPGAILPALDRIAGRIGVDFRDET